MVTRGARRSPVLKGLISALNAGEVDVSFFHIGPNQLGAHFVANVKPALALSEKSFDMRLQDANTRAVLCDPRYDRVEDFADPVLQGNGSQPFCHLSLDFSGGILF